MRLDISIEERFPVPIDRVWHALTDPAMIERWLMRPDGYEAKVGARFTLRETPRADCAGVVECEVLELSPPTPHRLVVARRRGSRDDAPRHRPGSRRAGDPIDAAAHGRVRRAHCQGTTGGWTEKLGALAELLTTRGGHGND